MWWLVDNGYFFDEKWHGAILSSVATFFSRAFHTSYIASSYDGKYLLNEPWGSSPLLDPYYSSAHFRIEHDGTGMSRLEKTAVIADWPVGLDNLIVCQRNSNGPNCGQCEKCIRTMTSLVALGKLQDSKAFSQDDVTPDLLQWLEQYQMIKFEHTIDWYKELVQPLYDIKRGDLAKVIEVIVEGHASR